MMAAAAGEERVDVDAIAFAEVADFAADFGDDAGRVQADDRGQRRQVVPVLSAEHGVHVGNDAAGLDAHEYFVRANARHGDRVDSQGLAGLVQPRRAHLVFHRGLATIRSGEGGL